VALIISAVEVFRLELDLGRITAIAVRREQRGDRGAHRQRHFGQAAAAVDLQVDLELAVDQVLDAVLLRVQAQLPGLGARRELERRIGQLGLEPVLRKLEGEILPELIDIVDWYYD
jgi:hypothetical protein